MSFKDGVSIIVTVFNKEEFIEETLNSICKQMRTSHQLIIVDDGSKDQSIKIINALINKNKKKNIKLIKKKNEGPSIAINKALKFVDYSFIKLVDGDDIIAPYAISYMKKEMEKLNIDLLYGDWKWVKKPKEFKFEDISFSSDTKVLTNSLEKFLLGGWGGSSNLMVKTQTLLKIGGCDENVFVQDFSVPMKISGYHLKKKGNERFVIAQTSKLICVGPSFIENRIMNINGQTLYDLSMATINFIETHPLLQRSLINKCNNKIISRCWKWQRRVNKKSLFSRMFLKYIINKIKPEIASEVLRQIVFQTWKEEKNLRRFDQKYLDRKKILVYVGLDLLGDGLIKIPFLKSLRNLFPNSEITWFAGKGSSVFKSTLQPLSKNLIDNVLDNKDFGSNFFDIFKAKNFTKYDIVIDTQKRFLTTLILSMIPKKLFVSASCKFWFSDFFYTDYQEKNLSKQLVDLTLFFSNLPQNRIYKKNINNFKKVAICPGASVSWKRWPINKFLEIADFLKKKKYKPIFILGPQEKDLERILKSQKVFKSDNPMKTLEFAKKCNFGISNDTGCGHLIASAGIPIITIFGPTDSQKFSPYGNPENVSISSQNLFTSKNIDLIEPPLVIEKLKTFLK